MVRINWFGRICRSLGARPSARQLRGFSRLWLPLATLVATLSLWGRAPDAAMAVAAAGGVLIVASLASQAAARAVFVTLRVLTWPIGVVAGTVLLAVTFYLVITPIGLVRRWAAGTPLQLRPPGRPSMWRERSQDDDPRRAFRQY